MIIGGVAVSLLGAPRYTADLDAVVLVNLHDVPRLLDEAAKLGITSRISDPTAFAQKSRVLLLRHNESGMDIDLSLGLLPFEVEMVERSQLVDVGPISLRLPSPEDLIIMKAVAHRLKDLEDIRAITKIYPNLDKEYIRSWIGYFGEALDMPDLAGEIMGML